MRKILVVIDMQRDFIDGALGTAEARAIVPAVIAKIKGYAPEDVFATRDTHRAWRRSWRQRVRRERRSSLRWTRTARTI